MPAVLTVEDIWRPDLEHEAAQVYGTSNTEHPGVRYLLENVNPVYVGGRIEGVQAPMHPDFEALWDTPTEMRQAFAKMGWRRVVAFQTSKPMHRLQREIALNAAKQIQAHILLHPTVGMTKPGDLHYYARVHCYQAIRRNFPQNLATLSLLPLAMRMAGPAADRLCPHGSAAASRRWPRRRPISWSRRSAVTVRSRPRFRPPGVRFPALAHAPASSARTSRHRAAPWSCRPTCRCE